MQLFLDVGAQRIAPPCAANRIITVRILRDLCKLVANVRVFRPLEMSFSAIAVYSAVFSDLDPLDLPVRIDRRPQRGTALGTDMVFPMLLLEEELIGRYGIMRSILADLHFNDCITVRAEERAATFIPSHGRIAHIAVPRPLLGKDRVHTLIALLVESIEPVQVCDAVHDHGIGVRQRFSDLTHPFSCDVGGAHDDAEGLLRAAPPLCSP